MYINTGVVKSCINVIDVKALPVKRDSSLQQTAMIAYTTNVSAGARLVGMFAAVVRQPDSRR